jgi:hypothetical protein
VHGICLRWLGIFVGDHAKIAKLQDNACTIFFNFCVLL